MKRTIIIIVILYIIYSLALSYIEHKASGPNNDNNHRHMNNNTASCLDSLKSIKLISQKFDICHLEELIETEKFIVLYSKKACEVCVYNSLQIVKSLISDSNLIVLTDINMRGLKFMNEFYNVSSTFYAIAGKIPDCISFQEKPLVVLLNRKMELVDYHVFENDNKVELRTFINKYK